MSSLRQRLSLAPFRLRIFFRGAFLLLMVATVAMALLLLREEKQRSYRNYREGLVKTEDQIVARLRHPSGQLALLNPPPTRSEITPLHPFVLPYASLDFDDRDKARQAVELAGCLVQYSDGSVCVAIGSSPWAGGFIYTVGQFASAPLVDHARGERDLSLSHRLRITAELRGERYQWIAAYERSPGALNSGRLTAFSDRGEMTVQPGSRPVKDFRGWLWQDARCTVAGTSPSCLRNAFYSVRMPVAVLRDALFDDARPVWPPPDLEDMRIRVEVLEPGGGPALFDSNRPGATPPFSLKDLRYSLLPGETLRLTRPGAKRPLLELSGSEDDAQAASYLMRRLIQRLPVEGFDAPIKRRQTIATALGPYTLTLVGDVRGVNRGLVITGTRMAWFVSAMLAAILLVWFVMELAILRPILELTRRAAPLAREAKAMQSLKQFDLGDLKGDDELGVLANGLAELLQRVQEDVEREHIRAAQEKDFWHAVGHEIMSPLQSLMALHGGGDDASRRYILRMQQAVRVLYGQASPSEAFQSTSLQLSVIDLEAFLSDVASNAVHVGIEGVHFVGSGGPMPVRADEHSLEDVITHILRNAARHRLPGSLITLKLNADAGAATVDIHNLGEPIPEEMIERIFEYGVSSSAESAAAERRGQGLFVARTYMAKMAGTVVSANRADGVSFILSLPRA